MINRTLQLLDQLEALGFTNAEFQALHHRGKASSIKSHRKYVSGLSSGFQPGSTNAEFEAKLERKLRQLQSVKEAK